MIVDMRGILSVFLLKFILVWKKSECDEFCSVKCRLMQIMTKEDVELFGAYLDGNSGECALCSVGWSKLFERRCGSRRFGVFAHGPGDSVRCGALFCSQWEHDGMPRVVLLFGSGLCERGHGALRHAGAPHPGVPGVRRRCVLCAGAAGGGAGQGPLGAQLRPLQPQAQRQPQGPRGLPQGLRGGHRGWYPCGQTQGSLGFPRSFLLRGHCCVHYR